MLKKKRLTARKLQELLKRHKRLKLFVSSTRNGSDRYRIMTTKTCQWRFAGGPGAGNSYAESCFMWQGMFYDHLKLPVSKMFAYDSSDVHGRRVTKVATGKGFRRVIWQEGV